MEPFTEVTVLRAMLQGNKLPPLSRPPLLAEGGKWMAAAGAFSVLGESLGHRAIELDGKMGALGSLQSARPTISGSCAWNLSWMAAKGWVAAQLGRGTRGVAAEAWTRFGAAGGAHLWASVAHRSERDVIDARVLGGAAGRWQALGWFDGPGTSLGTGLGTPLTRTITTALVSDWDADAGAWLAGSALLGYRHPCGCLAASAQAARRLGRPGTDAWLTVELMGP
jgi:hypothetical protein